MNFVILSTLVRPILNIRRSGRPAVIVSFFFLLNFLFYKLQRWHGGAGRTRLPFGGVGFSPSVYLAHYLRPPGRDFSAHRAPFLARCRSIKIRCDGVRRAQKKRTRRRFGTGPPTPLTSTSTNITTTSSSTTSSPRYEFLDYGDVVMPRRVNHSRFPRLKSPEPGALHESDIAPMLRAVGISPVNTFRDV